MQIILHLNEGGGLEKPNINFSDNSISYTGRNNKYICANIPNGSLRVKCCLITEEG